MQDSIAVMASGGAERHAQLLVTSSHPEGSARPIGIRQLKIQLGWDVIWGSAVMEYSPESSMEVEEGEEGNESPPELELPVVFLVTVTFVVVLALWEVDDVAARTAIA